MGNGIDKAVVLLAAPQFAHQKNRVDDHARNDQREKDDAEKQQHAFAPVEDDPADVEGTASATRPMPRQRKKTMVPRRLEIRIEAHARFYRDHARLASLPFPVRH